MNHIYSNGQELPVKPNKFITEDSNAGFEFFQSISAEKGLQCESAGGKSNLFSVMKSVGKEEICVVADGAAIGAEMSRLYKQTLHKKNM